MVRLFCLASFGIIGLGAQVLPGNAYGVSMGHLHILTDDPAAQRKLWVDVLGGVPGAKGALEYAKFPGVIVFFGKGNSQGGTAGSVVDHLGFLVKDFEGTKTKVAAVAKITSENQATRQFFAQIPGDINVEFTEDTTIDVPVKHHHVHFATPEVEQMREWYATVFGAKPGTRGKFQAADLPGANLSWKASERATAPTKSRSLDHIGFEVKDVARICKRAEGSGARIEVQPLTVANLELTIAFLIDPWGTRIELTQGLSNY